MCKGDLEKEGHGLALHLSRGVTVLQAHTEVVAEGVQEEHEVSNSNCLELLKLYLLMKYELYCSHLQINMEQSLMMYDGRVGEEYDQDNITKDPHQSDHIVYTTVK